ncbi:hypothetical protein BYT27DRAFT_7224747 [Phlegmacium glaucopus]|nr:hypothetical protein BYT27DRAFT_7224747 [Phlegmacium glaucopus]
MLESQVGINVRENHDLNYYKLLYLHLLEKYTVETPDFITFIIKEIFIEEDIKTGQISKIELREVKGNFNSSVLPFTFKEKYYGYLLQEIIEKLKDNKITLSMPNLNQSSDNFNVVDFNNNILFKVFLSSNKKYLIISSMTKDFVYNRIVFNNKTDNDIVSFIQNIKLEPIRYIDHKDLINLDAENNKLSSTSDVMTNPNYGVFDLESFIYTDAKGVSYSRVFALGFVTTADHFSNTPEDSANLVLKCIDNMLVPKYHNFIFYVHNLGQSDVVFLQKILLDYNLNVEEKDNQIIRLIVKLKNNNKKKQMKISFVDSLNLLNSSLDNLCTDYKVEKSKDNLNYVEEALIYLAKNLNSLLEILTKFQYHLWEDHNIEMTEAKNKFFKYYLKNSKIPLINTNNLFNFIYLAYYGGITEVYKPYGQDLTYLDVNSLYPFSAKNPMPGLEYQGLDLDKLFGVFHAEVITNDLYIGLLPVKTKTGIIFPNGKFEGYQIKVTKGFQFNKEFYELSQLKDELKGSQRQIVKSLLNNLLGRFALNFVKPITKTVHQTELDKILATKEVKTLKQLNDNIVNKDICESHGLDYHKVILNERKTSILGKIDVFHDTSVIISAFTTAYTRVYMHQIKLDILANNGTTDLSLNKLEEIMQERIGNKLGQLNFEYAVKEAYFISNKTYALLVEDGKVIKKAKGVSTNSLSYYDYQLFVINYSKGSVTIKANKINVNWNSYTKREKNYNLKTNLWTDTRPLYIDNLTKKYYSVHP